MSSPFLLKTGRTRIDESRSHVRESRITLAQDKLTYSSDQNRPDFLFLCKTVC